MQSDGLPGRENVVDDLLDSSDEPQGRTIWSALSPLSNSTGDFRPVDPLERLPNVFLLPGDLRLSEFEEDLTSIWTDCLQRKQRGFRGTTALSRLVSHIVNRRSIDFVFYDAGPNIGPLNRVILLDCDYFIVPVACDVFSIRALKTLGSSLAKWIKEWRTIAALAPLVDTPLLSGMPRFLGYVPQRFGVYRGDVASAYAKYLPQIERHVESDLVRVLTEVDSNIPVGTMGNRELGQVQDFRTIAVASQIEGRPMKDVQGAGNNDQKAQAAETFLTLARNIIERVTAQG
jgi:cellulose biosynthesis protein BcsQ